MSILDNIRSLPSNMVSNITDPRLVKSPNITFKKISSDEDEGGLDLSGLTSLVLNLDASAITGLSDGDAVETWSDISGEDNHATQSGTSNRPIYKTGIINSLPVVNFNPSTARQFLIINSTNSGIETTPAFTYFVVMSRSVTSNLAVLTKSAMNYQFLDYSAGWYVGAQGRAITRSTDTPQIFVGQLDTTSARRWLNGVQMDSSTGAADTENSHYRFYGIGAYSTVSNNPFNGNIAQIIVSAEICNATVMQNIVSGLAQKWGISLD
jgi:hypothetical protein